MGLILDKAIIFAVNAHRGQFRKGSDTPYILHPMEAAAIVGTMTADDEVLAAAVLHDTVEDTGTTTEQIREQFGERVAALVSAESENKREDQPAASTWKIRKVGAPQNRTDRGENAHPRRQALEHPLHVPRPSVPRRQAVAAL